MFVATNLQKIKEDTHATEESLGIPRLFETSHLPFFLPGGLVTVFYPIVKSFMRTMFGGF